MLIDVISGVIQPTLGVLAATGIIKGLLALFDFIGLIPSTSGTYQVWYAVADGFFYFLPILLGYSGLSDIYLKKYVEDSRDIWQDKADSLDSTLICSVIGTHTGPGVVAVAFFKKG